MLPAARRSLRIVAAEHPVAAAIGGDSLSHDEPLAVVQADSADVLAYLDGEKSKAAGVPAILVHRFGQGRVVYLPGRWCAVQCQNLTPAIGAFLRQRSAGRRGNRRRSRSGPRRPSA